MQYRPKSATDAEIFTLMFCGHCAHNQNQCGIRHQFDAARCAPPEWVYDSEGHAMCTAFVFAKPQEPGRCAGTIDMFEGTQ